MQSDEERWRERVRQTLEQETAEELCAAAKVFDVPRALRDTKPEAYAPHLFALGPYHQDRPELRNMERYKLAAAKRVEKLFTGGRKIDDLVRLFLVSVRDNDIQATYHRYLELDAETLALMMAIDTCFLLDFLIERYSSHGGETNKASSSCNWTNAVVRDAVMLENQVPLFLFAKTLDLCSDQAATMDVVLDQFVKHVSPIEIDHTDNRVVMTSNKPPAAHLLELLYRLLVPDAAVFQDNNSGGRLRQDPPPAGDHHHHTHININIVVEDPAAHHDEAVEKPDSQQLQQLPDSDKVKQACLQVSRLRFVDGLTRKVPVLAGVLRLVSMAASADVNVNLGGQSSANNSPPLADEIMVPSVTELAECGVRFAPALDGIAGIAFDRATLTLKLPVINLDANTEVVLRNLVAYEAVATPRGAPLVLARYTELMNGIIDTGKDVKLLTNSGVVVNRMKSNREAAAMWNGMCRAARLSRVPRLDAVVRALNNHRNATAKARAQRLLSKYVFGSWKMLTLLASVVLLLMTAMQTFCSAYPCDRTWFGALMQVPDQSSLPES